MFRTVGIISKHGDTRVAATLDQLTAFLARVCDRFYVDSETHSALPESNLPNLPLDELAEHCDLIIVVAGDGSFLSAARTLVNHDVPLLGINLGRLGFLTDISPEDMTARLEEIFAGHYELDERFFLETDVVRDGEAVFSADALNDVVVHKLNIARLVAFETYIDGLLVNTQRSDGLIVSTPTGSTAYALSGGGPILHPELDAVVLVPICPHTLTSRPLVVRGDSRIEVVVQASPAEDAQVTCDGQNGVVLAPGDHVRIGKKRQCVRLIHPAGHDYYATLRTKLHWGREL